MSKITSEYTNFVPTKDANGEEDGEAPTQLAVNLPVELQCEAFRVMLKKNIENTTQMLLKWTKNMLSKGNISKVKKFIDNNKPKGPKRPPSSYILYQKDHRKAVAEAEENQGKSSDEIAKILGSQWKNELQEVKDKYKEMFEESKKALALKKEVAAAAADSDAEMQAEEEAPKKAPAKKRGKKRGRASGKKKQPKKKQKKTAPVVEENEGGDDDGDDFFADD